MALWRVTGAAHATACGRPVPADAKAGPPWRPRPLLRAAVPSTGRSTAVAVGVARDRTLDVVPAIAHRVAGIVPGQARTALGAGALPVALQVGLGILEAAALVAAVGVVAVLVGRAVVVPVAVGVVVGGVAVLPLEMVVVLGGVHRLGDRVTGLGADHAAGDRTDRAADRATGRADGGTCDGTGDGTAAGTNAVVLLDVVHLRAPEGGEDRTSVRKSILGTGRYNPSESAGAPFSRSGARQVPSPAPRAAAGPPPGPGHCPPRAAAAWRGSPRCRAAPATAPGCRRPGAATSPRRTPSPGPCARSWRRRSRGRAARRAGTAAAHRHGCRGTTPPGARCRRPGRPPRRR